MPCGRVRVLGGGDAGPPAEYVDVEQRVGAQPVRAMHGHTRHLAGRVQTGHDRVVVREHLRVHVGRDAAHRVVRRRLDRDRVVVRFDAEIGPGELGDVGQLRVELLRRQVGEVEVDVVGVRAAAAAGTDLGVDGASHHVAWRKVLDGRGVALHEAFAVLVA